MVIPGPGPVMVPAVMQVVPVMVPVQVQVVMQVVVSVLVQVVVLVVMRCPGVGLGGVVGRPRWGGRRGRCCW
ncbi:hypothetical protein GCM10010530_40310 [Kribbella aluminosa]